MNLLLIVISRDKDLRYFAAKERPKLIPASSLSRGYLSRFKLNAHVNIVDPCQFSDSSEFGNFVISRVTDSARFLLLMPDTFGQHLVQELKYSALVVNIDPARAAKSYLNYFNSELGRALRILNFLAPLFDNASDAPLLSLPLRNFAAPELELLKVAAIDYAGELEFVGQVDSTMQLLRRRVRPRKKSSFKTTYAVDDKERFFVLGKERHSLPATGGSHFPHCQINGSFRFGVLIDRTRHFNVSEGEADKTSISGKFIDCHGTSHSVTSTTHLNMFSNDYF